MILLIYRIEMQTMDIKKTNRRLMKENKIKSRILINKSFINPFMNIIGITLSHDLVLINCNNPLINVSGCMGLPGTYKSIIYLDKKLLFKAGLPSNIPPLMASVPARIIILG